jgi:hypothetical protein
LLFIDHTIYTISSNEHFSPRSENASTRAGTHHVAVVPISYRVASLLALVCAEFVPIQLCLILFVHVKKESKSACYGEPGGTEHRKAMSSGRSTYVDRPYHTMGEKKTSKPPESANGKGNTSTWEQRIERGKGAKTRMQGKKAPGSFPVAVDYLRADGKVSKSFTFFDSATVFFRQTANMDQKNFYELIERDQWTKLYLDIEHYVDPEAHGEPSGIEQAIRVVKEALLHNWKEKFEGDESMINDVLILTASRHMDGCSKYKHSYHVIFPQIYFYGNTGLMKKLINSLQTNPMLEAKGKKGEPICMIDGNVYHIDQPFRLVESCKLVDGPPVGVLRPMDNNQPMTMAERLRTVVTHDEGGGIRIGEECIGKLDESSGRVTTKKRPSISADDSGPQRASKRRKEREEGVSLPPSCVQDFQQMLEQAGARQCDVTGEVIHKDGYAVLPLRNTGPRPCILSPGATHDSNNAFLIVNDDRVVFKCQSGKCQGRSKCLGGTPRSWQGHQDPVEDDTPAMETEAPIQGDLEDDALVVGGRDSAQDDAGEAMETEAPIQGDSEAQDGTGEACQENDMLYELNGDAHPTYGYEITHGEILQLLDRLAEVIDFHCLRDSAGATSELPKDIRVQDFLTVASILKRFAYGDVWQQWSAKHVHDEAERNRIWRDCNAQECNKDLSDIVKTVNRANKKGEPKILQPERVYFPQPKLSQENSARITDSINQPYLDKVMLEGRPGYYGPTRRVIVVQSATGTGKTTEAVAYAKQIGMPILSVCQLRSQVETHVEDFRKNGLSTVKYDDVDALKTFEMGKQSIVTTIDSLPKVKQLIGENVGQYIVLFDEFHSLTTYMNFSDTLQQTRREAVKAMRWLTIHAGRLIAMDNEITDIEFKFLDDALAGDGPEPYCDLTFIKNDFKKYADVPARHVSNQSEILQRMLTDIEAGNGFTVPCNTKKQAERIHEQLRQAVVDAGIPVSQERFKVYTSDQGTVPADVDAEWSRNWVIYSPTITTGIDFQPEEPQNVYLFLSGEDTISPAAALQMITRNRRIKAVYIHAMQMKNKPVYTSFAQMDECLDAACLDTPKTTGQALGATPCPVGTLRALQDGPYFNKVTGEDEYNDSHFSELYKKALWHDNVMRSAFRHNLDGLLRSRGFNVQRTSVFPEGMAEATEMHTLLSDAEADRRSTQAKTEAAEKYLESNPCDSSEEEHIRVHQRILAAMLGIKETERAKHWQEIDDMRHYLYRQMKANPDHAHVYLRLFTDPRTVRHYLNLKLAISTDERLQTYAERNAENDYRICTLHSINSRVQLLRQLIAAFNHEMLPTLCLKSYDLTLKQACYDEGECIEVPDEVWAKLQPALKRMRRPRERPANRRDLMDCIYILSQDLFGKHFTTRKKTEKASKGAPRNVYNYLTDQAALRLTIELLAVFSQDTALRDIEPEIVRKYDLRTVRRVNRMQ